MRSRAPVFALVLCFACAAPRPLRLPYGPAPDVGPAVPPFRGDTPVLHLEGVPALGRVVLPDSVRELRLSTGHGMILGAAYPLLRLVATPNRVRGEMLFYRCVQAAAGGACAWPVTVGRFDRPIDWGGILARLDALDVSYWRDTVPRTFGVMDAGELLVEEQRGKTHMRFELNAPSHRADALAQRAAAIARLVDSLASAARR